MAIERKPIPPRTAFRIVWDSMDGEETAKPETVQMFLLQDIRNELVKLNKTLTEASIFVNGKVG